MRHWAVAAAGAFAGAVSYGADFEAFERTVRPILAVHCAGCHGPEAQKAGLRTDHISTLLSGGDNGPAIVPGDPDGSRLIAAIRYDDVDLQMPPKGKLSEGEIAALTAWVAAGAPWPDEPAPEAGAKEEVFDLKAWRDAHWAWRPIANPAPPAVADASWPATDPDRFLLARLEAEGLTPARPADPATLLRRLTFDLTGLPPSPEEVAAFLADPSEAAYGAAVERLLASPRFGEHWGRRWLDLTRYAETHGQEQDFPIPEAWRYRDYAIRAFNDDVPYDQLLREHLAGDLLDTPRIHPADGTNESILATGFWFMYQAQHAPVDVRLDFADRIDNQIDVFSKTFLAMTVSCARCHDHKFDAISTADYYALAGVLRSSRRQFAERDPHGKRQEAAAAFDALKRDGAQAVAAALRPSSAKPGAIVAASASGDAERLRTWFEAIAAAPSPEPDARPPDGNTLFAGFDGGFDGWTATGTAFGAAPSGPGAWSVVDGAPRAVRSGAAHSGLLSNRLTGALRSPTFTLNHPRIQVLAAGKGGHIRLVIEGYHIREYHDLLFGGAYAAADHGPEFRWIEMDRSLDKYLGCEAYLEIQDTGDGWVAIDEIRFADGPLVPHTPAPLATAVPNEAATGARVAAAVKAWTQGAATRVDAALLNAAGLEGAGPFAERLAALEADLPHAEFALAMTEGTPVDQSVFIRGSHKDRGEVVPRRFLEAIDPTPFPGGGSGRLALAEALLDPSNPLTARVAVNRIWHHLFGKGLVPSVDNFGLVGQTPSHPELLDFLATRFRETGWSTKALVRDLVHSSAYRMSSRADDPAAEEKDPGNALLHRANLRRLPAESIRDAVLAAAGTLNETMYGPSVPAYLSPFMGGHRRPAQSGPMDGDRRRSVYLEVRRNFLPAFLMAFDFPAPDTAHGLRNVSNVPAQALILMNDPFVAEQAAAWGGRMASQEASLDERISELYLAAFGRTPTAEETARVAAFLDAQASVYGVAPDARLGDARLWADLCHALFTAKEFVYLG